MRLREELEKLYWKQERECNITDSGDYAPFYEHLKAVFLREIKSRYDNVMPDFTRNFMQNFVGNLKRITLRTLIFEMELCEECRELKGENEREKYIYFVENFLCNPAYLKEIYKEYPVMYEDMISFLALSVQNICEVIDCFMLDIKGINSCFFKGNPCHRIQTIDSGTSDQHNQGKTVLILELDNGEQLVYKPRSLAIDQGYGEFLQWVCQTIGVSYWWNSVWDRGKYGWCGWVANQPCISCDAIKQYYKRIGILLGISYLLGSEDMHYENLVAHGEYPVLIDLELAVGGRGREMLEEAGEGKRIFMESVLQTGLLPMYVWNKEGEGVNIGAINGGGSQSVAMKFPVIVNPGTVRMRVEYQKPYLKEGKNLATLNGEFVPPGKFLKEIISGFEKVYLFFIRNKEYVFEKLKTFEKVNVRYVARQTQEYFLLLISMYHPDYLGNGKDREDLLEELIYQRNSWETKRTWLRMQEGEELKKGDIPYFWYEADKTDLHSATGDTYKNYFVETSIQCMKNRLFRMDQRNMEYQKKLIHIAVSMDSADSIEKEGDSEDKLQTYDRSSKMGGILKRKPIYKEQRRTEIWIAEKIGELILDGAHWSDDKKEAGWINVIMADHQKQGYMFRPMGMYLYDGIAGVAVFMQGLAKETKKKCYQEMADLLVQRLFLHTDTILHINTKSKEVQDIMPTGALYGEASIAFAYMLLYLTEKNPKFLEYTKLQCKILSRSFAEDKDYDVIGGNAGAILVLLSAYKLTKDRTYVEWAREAGNALLLAAAKYEWGMGWINPVTKVALTGFAHGTSGIMLAFAKLGWITGEERYVKAAYQAFLYDEHFFDKKLQDWRDLRGKEPLRGEEESGIKSDKKRAAKEREHGMAWCHGWGGILMARNLAMKYTAGEFLEQLKEAAGNLAENKMRKEDLYTSKNFCLCHGNCGNMGLYSVNCMEKYGEQLKEIILKDMGKMIEGGNTNLNIQELNNYGLMGGIAGIGYYFLFGAEGTRRILSIEI